MEAVEKDFAWPAPMCAQESQRRRGRGRRPAAHGLRMPACRHTLRAAFLPLTRPPHPARSGIASNASRDYAREQGDGDELNLLDIHVPLNF